MKNAWRWIVPALALVILIAAAALLYGRLSVPYAPDRTEKTAAQQNAQHLLRTVNYKSHPLNGVPHLLRIADHQVRQRRDEEHPYSVYCQLRQLMHHLCSFFIFYRSADPPRAVLCQKLTPSALPMLRMRSQISAQRRGPTGSKGVGNPP